jgi:AcrR family transcriptional regulator
MARPLSDEKRNAILEAAIRVIASQGMSAPTAAIAKEAGVSNGSLFTYFETKADLFNDLFCELKQEMAQAALEHAPADGSPRERMYQMWVDWLRWSIASPERHRALAHLEISEDVTAESRAVARKTMASIIEVIEDSRKGGPMEDAPLPLVVALLSGVANSTIDFIVSDQANADAHISMSFEALWRIIA